MIHVIAIITTKPGQRAAVLDLFRANIPNVRAEAGCIEYEATVDAQPALHFQAEFGTDTFVVVEKWESPAALETHLVAPHMAAYAASVKELVASRAIHVLRVA